jgi:TRAP-type C4-dicarboxylate transport system permease small subunit
MQVSLSIARNVWSGTIRNPSRVFRQILDGLYAAGGCAAALFLLAVLLVILCQMVTRWIGVAFPGAADYAGYCMASASFFAFAHALNSGDHIRVKLLLNMLGRHRFWGEVWCLSIGSLLASYLAWYAVKAVYWSWLLGDISQGQDQMPLWIPQLSMAAGAILLAIAFVDNLLILLFADRDSCEAQNVTEHQPLVRSDPSCFGQDRS